jgi:hypothetical protein
MAEDRKENLLPLEKIIQNFSRINKKLRTDGLRPTIARKVEKIYQNLKRDGLRYAIVRVIMGMLFLREKDAIRDARRKVLNTLLAQHNSKVGYGPFKGMKLNSNTWWGKFDLISKILGVYEEHVLKKICGFIEIVDGPFVDIGAADGYFAVGMAFGGHCDEVLAYEISPTGRESLLANIKENNCEDRVSVAEEADYKSLKKLVNTRGSAVILIDIEGAEYDLLSNDVLELLKNCYVICELHPFFVDHGTEKEEVLINNAKRVFNVSCIQRDYYNPNHFSELDDFSDEERLLAFSEGRPKNMKWLVLEPK